MPVAGLLVCLTSQGATLVSPRYGEVLRLDQCTSRLTLVYGWVVGLSFVPRGHFGVSSLWGGAMACIFLPANHQPTTTTNESSRLLGGSSLPVHQPTTSWTITTNESRWLVGGASLPAHLLPSGPLAPPPTSRSRLVGGFLSACQPTTTTTNELR
jgi:hypothetical protein